VAGEKLGKVPDTGANTDTNPQGDADRYVLKKRDGSFSLETLRRNNQ
jgi:hypothetical protein